MNESSFQSFPKWHAFIREAHNRLVFRRRIEVLRDQFIEMIPSKARVLDVGCGDGSISKLIAQARPDISIEGIDILVRTDVQIPMKMFNGSIIPYADKRFDTVIFIDVLHHANDPMLLLKEAIRVARQCIVIKDHNREGFAAGSLLRLMDWIGNAPHGVALPYNYWSPQQWRSTFDQLNLTILEYRTRLGLYPAPACWIFERSLHFVARLDPAHAAPIFQRL